MVSCRNGKVVGYVSGTSLAAKAHVAIIQTMSHFPSSTRLLSLWPGLPVAASVFGADLSRPAIRSTTPVTAADIALHRPCHAQGLQWARHAPGVQFSRDLLDRL